MLSNNTPSEYWTGTMLHEFGHALYDTQVDPDLPWLLRTMHPLTTEGIAMLFGRLVRDVDWLAVRGRRRRTRISTSSRPRLAIARRASLLTFARWVLVMTHFERGLYADPDADHTSRWWELVERFQLLVRPGRSRRARLGREDAPRARAGLLPELPVRGARRVAAPGHAARPRRAGSSIGRPPARSWSTSSSRPGLSLRWDALVERATGEPLTARHLAAELQGG